MSPYSADDDVLGRVSSEHDNNVGFTDEQHNSNNATRRGKRSKSPLSTPVPLSAKSRLLYLGAVRSEEQRDLAADPGRRPGHNRHLTGQHGCPRDGGLRPPGATSCQGTRWACSVQWVRSRPAAGVGVGCHVGE